MPQIREYTQQTSAQGSVSPRQASGSDFGVGAQLTQFGQTTSHLGAVLDQAEQYEQTILKEVQIAEDRFKWTKRIDELKRTLPFGGVGMAAVIDKEMGEYEQETVGKFSHPKVSDSYAVDFARMKSGFQAHAISVHSAASGAQESFRIKEIGDKNENSVVADPSQVVAVIAQERQMIANSPRLSSEQKTRMLDEREETLWNASVIGEISKAKTPEQTEALLTSLKKESWQNRLNSTDYSRAFYALTTKKERLAEQRDTQFTDNLNEHLAEVSSGVLSDKYTESDIRANITDPDRQRKALIKLRQANEVGTVYSDIKSSSASERIKYVEDLVEQLQTPGRYNVDSGKVEAAGRALALQSKQYTADPVGYTMEINTDVANKRQTYEENPNPDTLGQFVNATKTEQMRQGTDPRDVVLLRPQDVAGIEQQFRELDKSTSPQNALVKIQEVRDQYGEYWPEVSKQLQKDKVLSGVHAIASGMPVTSTAAATQLIVAASTPIKEIEASIPEFTEVKKSVNSVVQTELAEFHKTLVNSINGPGQIKNYNDAVEKLALYQISKGVDESEAVSYAMKHIVFDRWEIQDGVRIPKSVQEPVGAIMSGARQQLQTMDLSDVVPYQSLLGVDAVSRKEATIDSIRSSGRFRTNDDETGLVLIDKDGYDVLRENGKIYDIDWLDAARQSYDQMNQMDYVGP